MINVIILFLIRKRLGLKKGEEFQFVNQRNKLKWYYIGSTKIMKQYYSPEGTCDITCHSNIGLNWLLDDRCKIIKKEV
jgi:hypothetical protein